MEWSMSAQNPTCGWQPLGGWGPLQRHLAPCITVLTLFVVCFGFDVVMSPIRIIIIVASPRRMSRCHVMAPVLNSPGFGSLPHLCFMCDDTCLLTAMMFASSGISMQGFNIAQSF